MVEAIRKHAPNSKIILGGYGTALGDELAPYADYICRGEGVAFMRKLLDEQVDAPIVQPVITQQQSLFSMPLLGKVGYVFAGLGCPNGCDFCATSHYFKRRHIKFLPDGPSILRAIKRLRRIYPEMVDIWINDEDFLLNEKRGRGFLEAIRQSDLPPLAMSIFSSVKALSQFTASELVEMGIDWVWVGFEGKRAGYAKMKGRPYRELFADLHNHGISVLASMIIGFDYQTPEIIQEEFEELMNLRPSMCQFLIYGPAHGTPAYERLSAEGRLRPEVMDDHTKQDGFYLGFKHPHIDPDEMLSIQRNLYRKEFEQMGPSVFRVVDDWLTGYTNLRGHPAERVRAKAQYYGHNAHRAQMLLPASQRYLNPRSADRLERLHQKIAAATGPMTPKERLMSKLVPAMLRYTALKLRHNIKQQPQFSRRTFRMGKRFRCSPCRCRLPPAHRPIPGRSTSIRTSAPTRTTSMTASPRNSPTCPGCRTRS
jgi:haloalkane dehalogenase